MNLLLKAIIIMLLPMLGGFFESFAILSNLRKIKMVLAMGIGISQLLVVLLIILVLFGAGRLPQVMGDLGKGIQALRASLKDGSKNEKE